MSTTYDINWKLNPATTLLLIEKEKNKAKNQEADSRRCVERAHIRIKSRVSDWVKVEEKRREEEDGERKGSDGSRSKMGRWLDWQLHLPFFPRRPWSSWLLSHLPRTGSLPFPLFLPRPIGIWIRSQFIWLGFFCFSLGRFNCESPEEGCRIYLESSGFYSPP